MSPTRKSPARLFAAALLAAPFAAPALAQPPEPPAVTSSSEAHISINKNGDQIDIAVKDGVLTSATRNGKDIPKDRVVIKGRHITILDDDGSVLTEFDTNSPALPALPDDARPIIKRAPRARVVPDEPAPAPVAPEGADPTAPVPRVKPRIIIQRNDNAGDPAQQPAITYDAAPKVVVGLRLAPVPAILAGHLGLKDHPGVLVAGVARDFPAAKAGLAPYDVITALNGKPVESVDQLRSDLASAKTSDKLSIAFIHNGEHKTATLSPVDFDRAKMAGAQFDEIESDNANAGNAATPWGPMQIPQNALPAWSQPGQGNMQGGMAMPQEEQQAIEKMLQEMMRQQQQNGMPADPFINKAPGRAGAHIQSDQVQDTLAQIQAQLKALQDRLDKMDQDKK